MKWITREQAKVDRIACPWFDQKFVDSMPNLFSAHDYELVCHHAENGLSTFQTPRLGDHGEYCSVDRYQALRLDKIRVRRAAKTRPRGGHAKTRLGLPKGSASKRFRRRFRRKQHG